VERGWKGNGKGGGGGDEKEGEEEGGSQSCVLFEKEPRKIWLFASSVHFLSCPVLSCPTDLSSPSKSVRSDHQRTSMLEFGFWYGWVQTDYCRFAFCTSTR